MERWKEKVERERRKKNIIIKRIEKSEKDGKKEVEKLWKKWK